VKTHRPAFRTLAVAAYTAFAPVTWSDEGVPRGKDIEFLRAFARRQGLQMDVTFFEFDRIWERPLSGQADIAAAGLAPFEHRHAAGVAWSIPYHTVQRSLVVRSEDACSLQTLEDFAGRTIAVTRGSTADVDTQMRKPASARVVYFDQQESAVQDLLAGRIDAFGTGDICSHHVAAEHPGRLAVTDVHSMEVEEHFAFALPEDSDLLAPLNQFIRENAARYPEVPHASTWSDYQI
jgi:polar amino acid transport system substrate-binding protein